MADELETMKDWIAKKQTNSSRITPAKKDKVFETKVKVSADPNNPIVGNIITFLNDGNRSAAEALAMNLLPNMLFMVVKQKENGYLFVKSEVVQRAETHL